MEDKAYKEAIRNLPNIDMVDKCLNEDIDSYNEEYIMRKIREDYLSDSTVTIFIIGAKSNENLGWNEQRFIKRELQASLYDGAGNTRNGILGVVLPSMYDNIFQGEYTCSHCGYSHNTVKINDYTVVKEFGRNYYLDNGGKCSYSEDDRYCVLVKWDDFKTTPNGYIEQAFNKRSHPIASKVIVYPK
jgi:glutaredoxin-related protein